MKVLRDLSGDKLARAMARVGYRVTRPTGSPIRLTLDDPPSHPLTICAHAELRGWHFVCDLVDGCPTAAGRL